jgi:hypothetical protein
MLNLALVDRDIIDVVDVVWRAWTGGRLESDLLQGQRLACDSRLSIRDVMRQDSSTQALLVLSIESDVTVVAAVAAVATSTKDTITSTNE